MLVFFLYFFCTFPYDDHHIIVTQKRPYICYIFSKRRGLKVIKYDSLVCHSGHMIIIILSYDDHMTIIIKQKRTHAIFFKRRGLNDIKYDVPVCHFCRKMIIQQANLLSPVHILKPYTFQSEFRTVVFLMFWNVSATICPHLFALQILFRN